MFLVALPKDKGSACCYSEYICPMSISSFCYTYKTSFICNCSHQIPAFRNTHSQRHNASTANQFQTIKISKEDDQLSYMNLSFRFHCLETLQACAHIYRRIFFFFKELCVLKIFLSLTRHVYVTFSVRQLPSFKNW